MIRWKSKRFKGVPSNEDWFIKQNTDVICFRKYYGVGIYEAHLKGLESIVEAEYINSGLSEW